MNLIATRTALLVGLAIVGAACDSSTAPKKPFSLCVHATGIPFVPGSTGAACVAPPSVRAGQTVTMVLEADNHVGSPRTADLTLPSGAPSGWTATLGGSTIAVPGQQTLTISVPAGTPAGFYEFTVLARVGTSEEAELTFNVRVTAPL